MWQKFGNDRDKRSLVYDGRNFLIKLLFLGIVLTPEYNVWAGYRSIRISIYSCIHCLEKEVMICGECTRLL